MSSSQTSPPSAASLPDTSRIRARKARRLWTAAEDDALKGLVARYGNLRGAQGYWKEFAQKLPGRTAKDCRKRWFHSLDPSLRKGRWTPEEDRTLVHAHARIGPAWHDIAKLIPGRKDDQCAKRYNDILNPEAKDRLKTWTADEDRVLFERVRELGHRWSAISAELPGRPPLTCRNRWRFLSKHMRGHMRHDDVLLQDTQTSLGEDSNAASTEECAGDDPATETILTRALLEVSNSPPGQPDPQPSLDFVHSHQHHHHHHHHEALMTAGARDPVGLLDDTPLAGILEDIPELDHLLSSLTARTSASESINLVSPLGMAAPAPDADAWSGATSSAGIDSDTAQPLGDWAETDPGAFQSPLSNTQTNITTSQQASITGTGFGDWAGGTFAGAPYYNNASNIGQPGAEVVVRYQHHYHHYYHHHHHHHHHYHNHHS